MLKKFIPRLLAFEFLAIAIFLLLKPQMAVEGFFEEAPELTLHMRSLMIIIA